MSGNWRTSSGSGNWRSSCAEEDDGLKAVPDLRQGNSMYTDGQAPD